MSIDLTVFLPRSQMPSPEQWAQAIVDAGFDVQLDSDFDVDQFAGFLPCKHNGVDAGFEYYSETVAPEDRDELGVADACDVSITFVTHNDMRELITSLVSAGVLTQTSGGTFFDPQSGRSHSADNILDWVRGEVAKCEQQM